MPYCPGEIEYCPSGCQWCGRDVPVRIANKVTQYSRYVREQREIARMIALNAEPYTAQGFGLDKLLEVMDLERRKENETDVQVRERIYEIFSQAR